MLLYKQAVADFLQGCKAARVVLVEWEAVLMNRLNYPLVTSASLFFLIPDGQLELACTMARGAELLPVDEFALQPVFLSEYSSQAARFTSEDTILNPKHGMRSPRLVLVPMSYTGLTMEDVVPISDRSTLANYTVPLPAACAALIRLVIKERQSACLREGYLDQLAGVIGYSLFNMNYEGDYLDIPGNDVPLSSEEIVEIDNAVRQIRGWEFRQGEEWMRDLLVCIISGEAKYEDILLKA